MIQTFLLDTAMILLLGMAIIFCWRLNGRMNSMKIMGRDILPAVEKLSGFITGITDQIDVLRAQSRKTQSMLSNDIPKAKALKEDLDVVLEYSENSSRNLETLIEQAKKTEIELREIHEIISKTFPRNFRDSLVEGDIKIDFDEMKRLRVNELQEYEDGGDDALSQIIIPMKVDAMVNSNYEYRIDDNIRAAIGDLH